EALISADSDPIGNVYEGTVNNVRASGEDESYSATGGLTQKGYDVQMNNVTFPDDEMHPTDMGDQEELVAHEFLHLMGLDDKGGIFYDKNGRMNYKASRSNNFTMKPISANDIKNILFYAVTTANYRGKNNDKSNRATNQAHVVLNNNNGNVFPAIQSV